MSKTDKLKEEIGWLKVIFGILVATDISLVAWLAQNYSSTIAVIKWMEYIAFNKNFIFSRIFRYLH